MWILICRWAGSPPITEGSSKLFSGNMDHITDRQRQTLLLSRAHLWNALARQLGGESFVFLFTGSRRALAFLPAAVWCAMPRVYSTTALGSNSVPLFAAEIERIVEMASDGLGTQ